MENDKKTNLPWGMSEKELKPNSVQNLPKSTLEAFSIGMVNPGLKKNVFQKSRDAKEKKKQKEDEETAKVLEEFVTTFEEPSKAKMTFIRGAIINPDKDTTGVAGTLYEPAGTKKVSLLIPTVTTPTPSPAKPTKKKEKEKKKSVLEMFGDELKRMQDERNKRHTQKKPSDDDVVSAPLIDIEENESSIAEDIAKGSYDKSDSTNLYIGNINPKMNEEMLCQHFGKFGALASIKIMWPRTEEERLRNRNCGFVAFMRRKDAEKALDAMKGSTILGHEVEIGWGKVVPLPPTPFYVAPDHIEEMNSFIPDPPTGLPFNARPISKRNRVSSKRGSYNNMPPPNSEGVVREREEPFNDDPAIQSFDERLYNSIIKVVLPTDKEVLKLIHRMIEFVIREGPMFEAMIMNKEMGNKKFRFLFDNQAPDHVYYRWKLFSILQGDSPETWKTDEFRMFQNGSLWRPPSLKNLRGKVLPPIMEIVKKGKLPHENHSYLENLLHNVTMERPKIREGMIWCMEHAESSDEIVECITESLLLIETPLPLKLARLYLMTDILQNTNAHVSCAARYRRGFENKLLPIMEHFHDVMRMINSRLRAESFKRRVLRCIQSWDQLTVYHFNFVDKLREQFIGKTQEEMEKKRAFETVAALLSLRGDPVPGPEPDDSLRPIDFSGGHTTFVQDDDIDGNPLSDPDVDGVPMEDDNEDIDGIPMEDDSIVIPTITTTTVAAANVSNIITTPTVHSKWELVDYGQGSSSEEEQGQKDDSIFPGVGTNIFTTKPTSTTTDPNKRQQLREVELKVIELVEALELSGSYTQSEIQERASRFREKMIKEVFEGKSILSSPDDSVSSKTDDGKKKDTKGTSPLRSRAYSNRDSSSSPPPRKDKSRSPSTRSNRKKKHSSPSRRRSRSRDRHKSRHKSPTHGRSRSRSPRGKQRSKSPSHRPHSPHHHHHHHSSRRDKRRTDSSRSPGGSPHRSKKSSSRR